MRALCLPGCGCRGAFQFAVVARLLAAGERFDLVAGASSGSVCGAVVVAGLGEEGPAMMRSLADTPIVSLRYLRSERSIFGMSGILRGALRRYVPEARLVDTHSELLVATTEASRFVRTVVRAGFDRIRAPSLEPPLDPAARIAARRRAGLVVHSNRERRDLHDVIVASCYIPIVYAALPRLDGGVHLDGGAADNTLLDVLVERGADDITMVSPYVGGVIAETLFAPERVPAVPEHVRLRIFAPERALRQKRFDLAKEPLEEALTMPHLVFERPARRAGRRDTSARTADS